MRWLLILTLLISCSDNTDEDMSLFQFQGFLPATQEEEIPIYPKLDINSAVFNRPDDFLDLPCSDGSYNSTHPGVLYIPDGWNGYKYWMAHTPYKDSDNQLENPEIVCSHDGINWVVPSGLTNPITPAPGLPYHNSDTDLLLDDDGTMYCYFNGRNPDDVTDGGVYVHKSTNGYDWGFRKLITEFGDGGFSPAVIKEKSGKYVMYLARDLDYTNPSPLYRYECDTPDGIFIRAQLCTYSNHPPNTKGAYLWHMDINYEPGNEYYYGIFNMRGPGYYEYLVFSDDGINWHFANDLFFARDTGNWDNQTVYRASMLIHHGETPSLEVFYSSQSTLPGEWHIGRGTASINYE